VTDDGAKRGADYPAADAGRDGFVGSIVVFRTGAIRHTDGGTGADEGAENSSANGALTPLARLVEVGATRDCYHHRQCYEDSCE
jgi:hypothetical protein